MRGRLTSLTGSKFSPRPDVYRPDVYRLAVCGVPWTRPGIVWENRLSIATIEASATTMLRKRGYGSGLQILRWRSLAATRHGGISRKLNSSTGMTALRRQGWNLSRRQTEAEQIGSLDLSLLESTLARGVREVDGGGGS